MKRFQICLVEDDLKIKDLIADQLLLEGYEVSTFKNSSEFYKLHPNKHWDLYILDILIQGKREGLEICKSVREIFPKTPLLFLSALSEPDDRVMGLEMGADDYLPKPFDMEELLLRVKGMLRRKSWYAQRPQNQSRFHWQNHWVDFDSYEAFNGHKQFLLSEKECMLMKLLVEKRGLVVKRDEILDRVWGYHVYPSSRTVDNFIVRLRKYFETESKYFHTVRGVGYKFSPQGANP